MFYIREIKMICTMTLFPWNISTLNLSFSVITLKWSHSHYFNRKPLAFMLILIKKIKGYVRTGGIFITQYNSYTSMRLNGIIIEKLKDMQVSITVMWNKGCILWNYCHRANSPNGLNFLCAIVLCSYLWVSVYRLFLVV